MFCKNCGAKLKDDARFCKECGTKVAQKKGIKEAGEIAGLEKNSGEIPKNIILETKKPNMIKQIFDTIDNGDFTVADAFIQDYLASGGISAEIYLAKLFVEMEVKNAGELKKINRSIEGSENYKEALRLSDDTSREKLMKITEDIEKRIGNRIFCESCGAKFSETTKFCKTCGATIDQYEKAGEETTEIIELTESGDENSIPVAESAVSQTIEEPTQNIVPEAKPEIKKVEICKNCGAEVLPNREFCHKCGADINPTVTIQTNQVDTTEIINVLEAKQHEKKTVIIWVVLIIVGILIIIFTNLFAKE